jgi:hypothetical protein
LATKIRNAVFSVFGEQQLPSMKTKALPAAVDKWKNGTAVKNCRNKLFKPMDAAGNKKNQ